MIKLNLKDSFSWFSMLRENFALVTVNSVFYHSNKFGQQIKNYLVEKSKILMHNFQSICVDVRSTPAHCADVHTVCGECREGYFIESVL